MSIRSVKRMRILWLLALLAAALLPAAVYAGDQPAPTAEPVTDSPNPSTYRFFLSTPNGGNIGNISYADEDILSYKPATGQWLKSFDGTNAGLPAAADVDAIAYRFEGITSYFYMSFDTPVNVPGLGKVDDSDVVVYQSSFGGASWAMVLDGSLYGLTTAAEDVDGFELATTDEFMISTSGNFSVPGHYGNTITGGDEDIIRYVNGKFTFTLDGGSYGLAAGNDVNALAYEYGGEGERFFLVTTKPFNLAGAAGGPGDVLLRLESSIGVDSNSLFWNPAEVAQIDALELKREP